MPILEILKYKNTCLKTDEVQCVYFTCLFLFLLLSIPFQFHTLASLYLLLKGWCSQN